MKYLEKSFSSRPSSKEYRDNYDKVFAKKPERANLEQAEKFVEEALPGLTRTEKRKAAEGIVNAFKNVKGFGQQNKPPENCGQCGQSFVEPACGFSHAIIQGEKFGNTKESK